MNLSLRLSKEVITPEQIERKRDAERVGRQAKKELEEARELAAILRDIREKNHFATSFRKALGGGSNGR